MTNPPAESIAPPPLCARCGAAVSGRYCGHCGAVASPRTCLRCAARLGPGARFCHRCGAAVSSAAGRRTRNAWLGAGAVVVLAVIVGIRLSQAPPEPLSAVPPPPGLGDPGLAGPAPDISGLTPRQRFDRLFDRVRSTTDAAAVIPLADHALQAYAQLDTVDTAARFRAAYLQIRLGRIEAAQALADTILAAEPDHLLGLLVHGAVAELRGDSAGLRRVRAAFLAAWPDPDLPLRAEYLDHREELERFHRAASPAGAP